VSSRRQALTRTPSGGASARTSRTRRILESPWGCPLAATPTGPVTGDELLRHRLAQLEEWRVESAATLRSTERRVDIIDIENSTVKGLLVELRTEVRERDEHARTSLARLHERLDEFGKEVNGRRGGVQYAGHC
jgi:hypothetical protein